MIVCSKEEIEKLEKRWESKSELIDKIIKILKFEDPINLEPEEIQKRLEEANAILTKNEFPAISTAGIPIEPFVEYTVPEIDLRGINLHDKDCSRVLLLAAHLEGANLTNANFEGANLRRTYFSRALISDTGFRGAYLEESNMNATVLVKADFNDANMKRANIRGAHFNYVAFSGANLQGAKVGSLKLDELQDNQVIGDKSLLKDNGEDINTIFENITFLPYWRDHVRDGKDKWQKIWKHIKDRWFYTNFLGVDIDRSNTIIARDLSRYIQDQQFLYLFKKNHPKIYFFWKWLTDCGGRLSWVAIWSGIFVVLFALMYWAMATPVPEWLKPIFPHFLMVREFPINPRAFFEDSSSLGGFWKWFFVSFDIFSNLGVRSTQPQNPLGVFLVITESVLGFMMLGMLISVLANRFARRS